MANARVDDVMRSARESWTTFLIMIALWWWWWIVQWLGVGRC